jgi:hypothetical protein
LHHARNVYNYFRTGDCEVDGISLRTSSRFADVIPAQAGIQYFKWTGSLLSQG